MYVKCLRNQMSSQNIILSLILMYLCKSFFPIKIVSHENVIHTLGSLEISKQLILLPTAVFTTDTNSIFSYSLSLTHTLSLCLSSSQLFSPSFCLSINMMLLCKNDYQLSNNKRLRTYKQAVSFGTLLTIQSSLLSSVCLF